MTFAIAVIAFLPRWGFELWAATPRVSICQRRTPLLQVTARISVGSATSAAQGRIPLFSGGAVKAQVNSAKLQREQARRRIDAFETQVRAQVAQSWYGYDAATRSIEASRRQVEAAEIAYEGAKEELAVGVRTTLDVLDQEQQLFEARLALVGAERDAYVAAHQLLRAIGGLDTIG